MPRLVLRRAPLAVLVLLVCAAVAAPAAPAATLPVGVGCARYVPQLAGAEWIPVSGTGFTPNTDPTVNSLELDWPGGDIAGYSPLGADGSFGKNLLMPSNFIRSQSGRVKTYTLTATDRATPGLTASTRVTFVRVGLDMKPAQVRHNVHKRVRWSVYGVPTGASLFAH